MTTAEILCLFAKNYLTEKQFENYLYRYSDEFENELDKDTCFELISADYSNKSEVISLKHRIEEKYTAVYEAINDSFVEKLKREYPESEIAAILTENDKKADRVVIDLSITENEEQLIKVIKSSLKIPSRFGTSWDSLYDIGDAFLPKRLVFSGYHDFKKRQPEAAAEIIRWFSRIDIGECIFDFD